MASTEQTRKFDFYKENIMLNIANGSRPVPKILKFATFPTLLSSNCFLRTFKQNSEPSKT
jgi:hypothetical protein